VRTLDPATLTPAILAKLGDWSGLMGRRVAQARQILRHLLVGRITFTPEADGTMAFVGSASLGPLIAGTALAGLSKAGVSQTGFEPVFEPRSRFRQLVRAVTRARPQNGDRTKTWGGHDLLGVQGFHLEGAL
jgi:hypothetical protein